MTNQLTISVAAGKGGTGKTLFATSLAVALNKQWPGAVQLLDCDVEEPNADILLHPTFTAQEPVYIKVPEVDKSVCIYCGKCAEACQFAAIAVIREAVLTFPELCAGCGSCSYVCPVDAITEVNRQVGVVDTGKTPEGIQFVQGRVNVGDQRATPCTKAVREHLAANLINILDAPPGTACPMQETIEDTDYCVLVTEPTPFGLENLKESIATCKRMAVPYGVVINRDGIGDEGVAQYCQQEGVEILLRIPQQREVAEAYSRGETLAHGFDEWVGPLQQLYEHISSVTVH